MEVDRGISWVMPLLLLVLTACLLLALVLCFLALMSALSAKRITIGCCAPIS
jgi:hypothetical protein